MRAGIESATRVGMMRFWEHSELLGVVYVHEFLFLFSGLRSCSFFFHVRGIPSVLVSQGCCFRGNGIEYPFVSRHE